MRFHVAHRTTYRYGLPMADGYTIAHLLPRETPHQRVLSAEVEAFPTPDEREDHYDFFGNRVVRLGVHQRHTSLEVMSRCEVEVATPRSWDSGDMATDTSWEETARSILDARDDRALEVAPFAAITAATPSLTTLDDLAADVFTPGRSLLDTVQHLSNRVFSEFRFDGGATDVSTPLATVVEQRRGVCQDFAHLLIAIVRRQGLAARYVSGYLETDPPPGQPKMIGSDASHAWCSVWSPVHGWIDVDPTNDQMPPRRHVTVGWGRDYFDVTPVRGVVLGPACHQELEVGVDVIASTT
jgi:transglutaminase-like putative cysteine protease